MIKFKKTKCGLYFSIYNSEKSLTIEIFKKSSVERVRITRNYNTDKLIEKHGYNTKVNYF